jgi:hypothetical protein
MSREGQAGARGLARSALGNLVDRHFRGPSFPDTSARGQIWVSVAAAGWFSDRNSYRLHEEKAPPKRGQVWMRKRGFPPQQCNSGTWVRFPWPRSEFRLVTFGQQTKVPPTSAHGALRRAGAGSVQEFLAIGSVGRPKMKAPVAYVWAGRPGRGCHAFTTSEAIALAFSATASLSQKHSV